MIEAAERDGQLRPGGTHRRADLGQHRHRPGHRRAAEGLPRDRGHAGQDVQGEDRPPARLRRRGRGRADRRAAGLARVLLPRRRAPGRGDPGRLPAQPVLQPRQPAGALRLDRARAVGADRRARSRTSSPASARAARSPASGATSRSATPTSQVIGADPVGSIYCAPSDDEIKPYLVEGVGEDFWPETFDRRSSIATIDGLRQRLVPDDAPAGDGRGHPRRRLVRHRAVDAALRGRARDLDDPDALVVVDPPRRRALYLSKVFNDAWMTQYGFLERAGDQTVGDVLRRQARRRGEIPSLVTVQTHQKVRDAVALLHEHRVSQLPVVSAHDPASSSARSASAACWHARSTTRAARRRDRRRHGAAASRRSRPTTRCARRSSCWSATVRRCWSSSDGRAGRHRHARRPARGARAMSDELRHPRRPRGPRAGPDLRLGHPGDPPDLDLRAARRRRVRRGLRLRAHREPDAHARWRRALGELEGGLASSFSSGMAATHALITAVCAAGDHVVLPADLYGGTYRLVDKVLARWGLTLHMVDQTDLDAARRRGDRRDAPDLGRDARPTRC